MYRIVALAIAVLLSGITVLFSDATEEQKKAIPAPIRSVATVTLNGLYQITDTINDTVGARLKRGYLKAMDEVSDKYGDMPQKSEGLLAMNQDLTAESFASRLIPDAALTNSKLDDVSFSKTLMEGAQLDGASALNGNFTQTVMINVSARGTDFSSAKFFETNMTGMSAQGAIFKQGNFNAALLRAAQYSGADFSAATIYSSYGDNSIFYGANFSNATLVGSDFTKANFDRAKFINTTMTDINLDRASFDRSDLSGADLKFTLNLTQDQLLRACGNAETKLPDGLTIEPCGTLR